MNQFNYMGVSPYSNPAVDIEKNTNEFPAEKKAATRTRKKAAKKSTRKSTKTTKKAKKAE